tara:strand:- start:599 stop:862 length:264 start_codon:yes stop_codon:yes gene_type:complete
MKPENQHELIAYLTEVLEYTRVLQQLAATRNKTKKFKAISSMLKIVEGRASGTLQYAKGGGYSELPLTMQQHMYDPILDWLNSEATS